MSTTAVVLSVFSAVPGSALLYCLGRLVRDVFGYFRDVLVARINAKAQVEVARLQYGYRPHGGAHRAEE